MTNQEKLDVFQANINAFINGPNPNDKRAWNKSHIARTYMILMDEFGGADLISLHDIALAAVPQLNAEFGARLTAINER